MLGSRLQLDLALPVTWIQGLQQQMEGLCLYALQIIHDLQNLRIKKATRVKASRYGALLWHSHLSYRVQSTLT